MPFWAYPSPASRVCVGTSNNSRLASRTSSTSPSTFHQYLESERDCNNANNSTEDNSSDCCRRHRLIFGADERRLRDICEDVHHNSLGSNIGSQLLLHGLHLLRYISLKCVGVGIR